MSSDGFEKSMVHFTKKRLSCLSLFSSSCVCTYLGHVTLNSVLTIIVHLCTRVGKPQVFNLVQNVKRLLHLLRPHKLVLSTSVQKHWTSVQKLTLWRALKPLTAQKPLPIAMILAPTARKPQQGHVHNAQ